MPQDFSWDAIAARVMAWHDAHGWWATWDELVAWGEAAAAAPGASSGPARVEPDATAEPLPPPAFPVPGGGGAEVPPPAPVPQAPTPTPHQDVQTGAWVDLMPLMDRTFGHADLSVPGQITVTSYASEGWVGASANSGAMVAPTGPEAGFGYGTYRFTLSTHGGETGDFIALWPSSDRWPGPELDVVELDFNGQPYSSIHWNDAGQNAYTSRPLDAFAFDPYGVHTYEMRWEPGRITVSADGIEQYTTTENVPLDFAHGGQNSAPGVGMQTWWSVGEQVGNNTVTLYEASYSPL